MNNLQQNSTTLSARRISLSGKIQGVGFRPFIYWLAIEHDLVGWVKNCLGTVEIHVQGKEKNINNFVIGIFKKAPQASSPRLESDTQVAIEDFINFNVEQSDSRGDTCISLPTDLFLCDDCLAELNDPADRRYRYPFINCAQCGPRYTLIKRLPYDRSNTSMANFELCNQCREEYEDPGNRRFHAEPIACPECGPSLIYRAGEKEISDSNEALKQAVNALLRGMVVAVKGIGGYHLMCDASNSVAVARLRRNKNRPDKPLAVIFPAPVDHSFMYTESCVSLSDKDKAFLLQPDRPILLVEKSDESELSELIAPDLNEIGVMLPYSPLHHLLLNDFSGPLVATSANISGEPVLTENNAVEKRLGHVADAYLHHNRPIERPADDPVYRTIAGKIRPVRMGRGTAPIELSLPFELERPVLALGAHTKNTITLAWKNRAVISPHIGEMDSLRSLDVFEHTINSLQNLYGVQAAHIICDAHPSYTMTRWAAKQNFPCNHVYHHHAHASAAYFECGTDESVIAFTWDGVGYGEDKTLWGGETFIGKPGDWNRVASMRPFNLVGGDKVSREPWRSAAALCWEIGQSYDVVIDNHPLLQQAWQQKINAPQSSSIGRLFDAAAALTSVRSFTSFEAQAAMEFEALCEKNNTDYLELELRNNNGLLITDWEPLVAVMLNKELSISERASLFHHSLAQAILQQAKAIRHEHGVNRVTFSGGVFNNRVLTEQAMALLLKNDFEVYIPELIPVNDASISFGQVMEYGYK